MIGQPKRLATARATTQCVTMRVEKIEILQLLEDEPAFSKMFISHFLRETRRSKKTCRSALQFDRETACRVPLLLANFGEDGRPEPIVAKISQETLPR